MKAFFFLFLLLLSYTLPAQQFNRQVTNQDIKSIAGIWNGNVVKTDTAYNNAMLNFTSKVEITESGDSLLLNFTYTDANGKHTTEKTSLNILPDMMIRIGGVEYELTSMSRRGITKILVAEKQAYENYKLMDFRQQIILAPNELKIIREARFIDMDAYFIRYRSVFRKK